LSQTAEDIAKSFESCVLTAYWDKYGNCWTVGWGHTGKEVYDGLVWDQPTADSEFEDDMTHATLLLNLYTPGIIGRSGPGTYEALRDFVFNLGIGRYKTSTLRKLIEANDLPNAKLEILKWDHSNGIVVPGLLRRREAEATLIGV
jgi:lysozyme